MESARTKENLQLEDYSISQMTLDEVYLHIFSPFFLVKMTTN